MSGRGVVIGAGVVGATAALHLAERGFDVTVVEAETPGSGTSGTSFAHVNASYPGYWDYYELRAAGVAGYRRMRSRLGAAPWFVDTGFLQFEEDARKRDELTGHAERLQAAGYPVTRMSAARAERDLEPDLAISRELGEGFFYPDEGYVETRAMVTDLLQVATNLGAVARSRQQVVGFQTRGDSIRGVVLDSGEHVAADVVVCCCGRSTDTVLALAGAEPSLLARSGAGSAAPGLVVASGPVTGRPKRVVCINGLNVRPVATDSVMLWSAALDGRLQARGVWDLGGPTPAVPEELPRQAVEVGSRYLPALRATETGDDAYVCVRPLPVDGLPVVGWVPHFDGLYVIVAHAAVTLAPALGELAASEITDGRDDPRLARFRPGRFSSSVSADVAGNSRSDGWT